jgi:hypothetical protein
MDGMNRDAPGGLEGFWTAVASLVWRRLRESRLLPSVIVASIIGLALFKGGADATIVLSAVVGGVAAAQAILQVLQPMRVATEQTLEDYLAGRTEDDATGCGYQVFRVLDIVLAPAAAWFMAQWLAATLPQVPESFFRTTFALSVIAICLAWLIAVARWVLRRRSKPRR